VVLVVDGAGADAVVPVEEVSPEQAAESSTTEARTIALTRNLI
jgi:hypothetical protein